MAASLFSSPKGSCKYILGMRELRDNFPERVNIVASKYGLMMQSPSGIQPQACYGNRPQELLDNDLRYTFTVATDSKYTSWVCNELKHFSPWIVLLN